MRGDDRPEALVTPGDHHERQERWVDDRRQREEDADRCQGKQAEPARYGWLGRCRARPHGPHDAPGHESDTQQDLHYGRFQVLGGVVGEERAPIDAGDPRADHERERRAERRRAEDGDAPESEECAILRPSSQRPEREQRPREVEAGESEGERGEQQLGHPQMITLSGYVPRRGVPSCWVQGTYVSYQCTFVGRTNHPFGGFAEEAHRGWMRSQASMGEVGRALKHYEELVVLLKE